MKWDAGDRQYELVEGWGELPDGWVWGQCAGVAVDSEDNVHVFTRTEHPYMVFDKSGKLIDHWGEGIFGEAHGLCITPNDDVYFIEHTGQVILKFDKSGRHRLTLGTRNQHSDTEYTQEIREPLDIPPVDATPMINGVGKSAGPFHQPTDLTVAPDGTIYITDGYRNARVHKFAADGTLLASWGEPGNAKELRDTKDKPNYFHTPHGVWVHDDKVYAADRENNRIQIFTPEGEYLDMWLGFDRPTKIYVDPIEEVMYVSELNDRCSILDLEGNIIGQFGAERSNEPGKFWGPHTLWKDSEQAIYVGEVLGGARLQKFARTK
jgi:DNA-binding beta-propeller fold protein YncE